VASFCLLAESAAAIGDVDLGFTSLGAIAEEHRGAFFAPEIERIRGELFVARDGAREAERCFRRALTIARTRNEHALELRAATSLARLLARSARRAEGRRAVAEAYGWFTEGFETADLRAARALLEA
jgi:hypothetical protein